MLKALFGKRHTITILPHPTVCPGGEIVKVREGRSLAETLVDAGVDLGHSCQFQGVCTSCHVEVMEGQAHLSPMDAEEDRLLGGVARRSPWSRLACQCVFRGGGDIIVEIGD